MSSPAYPSTSNEAAEGPADLPETAGPARTFRGRSLEEILPRIREELGDDAVVLRRREGLAGGVGGFFQQRYVEVEAAPAITTGIDAVDDEPALPPLLDGASFLRHLDVAQGHPTALARRAGAGAKAGPTDEAAAGAAPVVAYGPGAAYGPTARRITQTPVAGSDRPAPATSAAPERITPMAFEASDPLTPTPTAASDPLAPPAPAVYAADVTGTVDDKPAPAPADGPRDFIPVELAIDVEPVRVTRTADRRRTGPTEPAAADPGPATVIAGAGSAVSGGVPIRPAVGRDVRGTVDADVTEYGLVARGLAPGLARDVVTDALLHGVPLDPARRADRAVRSTLARRVRGLDRRAAVSRIAIAGVPDSDRATVLALLAAAYADAGRSVLVIGSGDAAGLRRMLAAGPSVDLLGTDDAEAVASALRDGAHDVTLVDAPITDPADAEAIAVLADRLEAAGVEEVHVAIPAATLEPAVSDLLDALDPLEPDALALTRVDGAQRPGGPIGQAIVRDLPLSYLATGDAITLAEPTRVARMVLP
ncbi:MAG: hypothetical protein AB7G37_14135 [Solirubrobacteraceae bacterium]